MYWKKIYLTTIIWQLSKVLYTCMVSVLFKTYDECMCAHEKLPHWTSILSNEQQKQNSLAWVEQSQQFQPGGYRIFCFGAPFTTIIWGSLTLKIDTSWYFMQLRSQLTTTEGECPYFGPWLSPISSLKIATINNITLLSNRTMLSFQTKRLRFFFL